MVAIGSCPVINLAQEIWHEGYVISLKNDSLYGKIQILDYEQMSNTCLFKSQNSDNTITYRPSDIKGYVLHKLSAYTSRELPKGKSLFLEYLVEGKLDLFYLKTKDKERYFIQTDSLPLKEIEYINEIRNINGVNYHYKSKVHIGVLSQYTKDAPQLYHNIVKLKPDFNDLRKLAIDYHLQVCPNEKCISYKNNEKYTYIAIGPHIGITSFDFTNNDSKSLNFFAYGLYVRMSTPRINERLIFKTGAIFSENNRYTNSPSNYHPDKIMVKIPIQLEYIWYQHPSINPKTSIGFNYYTIGTAFLGAGLGLDITVNKKSTISMILEKEVYQIFNRISAHSFYSVLVGVYFRI